MTIRAQHLKPIPGTLVAEDVAKDAEETALPSMGRAIILDMVNGQKVLAGLPTAGTLSPQTGDDIGPQSDIGLTIDLADAGPAIIPTTKEAARVPVERLKGIGAKTPLAGFELAADSNRLVRNHSDMDPPPSSHNLDYHLTHARHRHGDRW